MKWARAVFVCSRCGRACPDPDELRKHRAGHAVADRLDSASVVRFACSTCGAQFDERGRLAEHMASHQAECRAADRARQVDPVRGSAAAPSSDVGPVATEPGEAAAGVPAGRLVVAAAPQLVAAPEPVDADRRVGLFRRSAYLAAAIALVACIVAGSALAWFTGTTSGLGSVSTGSWAADLTFKPGCSRAWHSSTWCRSHSTPVATVTAGVISLDLGDVGRGETRVWCDVLRVKSSADGPIQVAFATTGGITPFVHGVAFAGAPPTDILGSGRTRSLALQVTVPKRTTACTYRGSLVVTVLGSSERHEFRVTLTVVKGGWRHDRHPGPSARHPGTGPEPGPHPVPGPTAATPSTSPSSSPTSDPEPSSSPPAGVLALLEPGASTTLPGADGSPGRAVARRLDDGSLVLDFGPVPAGTTSGFTDVVRLTAVADETADVALSVSGPASAAVSRVGLRQDDAIACVGLSLLPGARRSIAFELSPGPETAAAQLHGTLTALVSAAGIESRWDLPLTLAVTAASSLDEPASPSPGRTP